MNYILGSGIAGLIAAYYNDDYTVITNSVGSQLATSSFMLGPKFLHKSAETQKLLADLGLHSEERQVRVGFSTNNIINNVCTEEFRKQYYIKTRENVASASEIPEHILSANKSTGFTLFDIDIRYLMNVLEFKLKDRIIIDSIKNINISDNTLGSSRSEYCFDSCISTLPAPLFYKLSLISNELVFKFKPITFVLTKVLDASFQNFDYVYFSDRVFSRVTTVNNKYQVYEFTEELDEDEIKDELSTDLVSIYKQKFGKIVNDLCLNSEGNIKFLGRYAEWNSQILASDVIKKVLEWKIHE